MSSVMGTFARCPSCTWITQPSSWAYVLGPDGAADLSAALVTCSHCGREQMIGAGDVRDRDGEHTCPRPGCGAVTPCPAAANYVRCAACRRWDTGPGGAGPPRRSGLAADDDYRGAGGWEASPAARERLERAGDADVVRLAREACREITAIFRRHGLLTGEAPEPAAAAAAGDISGTLMWLAYGPGRLVYYDDKCVYDGTELAGRLGETAGATAGEWVAGDIESRPSLTDGYVAFTTGGVRHAWEFGQESKYVSLRFYELRDGFAGRHLPGRFLAVATGDQCHCSAYLPAGMADEIDRVLALLPGSGPSGPADPGYAPFQDRFRQLTRPQGPSG